MSEKKTDRRTLKTRKAIRDAFAELLTEKELSKVTIQEIADKADINRATFYKHYLDVYDLYDRTEEDILVQIGMLVLQLGEQPSDRVFAMLMDYVDENRAVFKLIFSPNAKGTLRAKFDKCMEGLFRQIAAEKMNIDLNDSLLRYQTCYHSQGCIAIISQWVASGFDESKDFIVRTVSELNSNMENIITVKPVSKKL